MNPTRALCPKCQTEVTFVEGHGRRTCTSCGWSHALASAPVADSGAFAPVWTILRVFLWVAVILVAVATVGLAVLFVGCATAFKM